MIRKERAMERENFYSQLEQKPSSKTFFQLKNLGNNKNSVTQVIRHEEKDITCPDEQREVLAKTENVLLQYSLPSIDELLIFLPTKIKWKQSVRHAINTFWSNKFRSLSREKSTLTRLCTDIINIGEIHPVWKTATEIPGDTKKAITKARILTGTYLLQATKAKFNIGSTDPICPLCKLEEENLLHFLTRCPSLEGVRRTFYAPLKQAVINKIGIDQWKTNFQNRETLSQLIVDCRKLVGSILPNDNIFLNMVETISRNLCDKLHQQRLTQINSLS
ncbi:unnamed protein product [Mytilus edulis]|uniref:Reverse transcriptase zinc-binding domain-containing protein n=1 Tax=Mytilus edulis TaxID=6550 RepID=A0A8S3PU03_MYTED|nr:unnamed protein product [Mytilus edulis]